MQRGSHAASHVWVVQRVVLHISGTELAAAGGRLLWCTELLICEQCQLGYTTYNA
jgi:hypothetical protein